jgi:hypothetical protein
MSAPIGQAPNVDESSAFFANNDASSYNTRYLKSIRNKERFQELHFYQCTVELIDELFPKQAGKGTLDPPAAYRASAVALAQWRELSAEEQFAVIEKETEAQGGETKQENELKRDPSGVEGLASPPPAPKVAKTDPAGVTLSIPDRWDPASDDLDVDFCKDRTCHGITLGFLKKNYPIEEGKMQGFGALIGDAIQNKAHAYKNGQSWPFAADPRVIGAIVDQVPAEGEKTIAVLKWICVHLGEEPTTNRDKLFSVQLHHITCDRNSSTTPCQNCKDHAIGVLNLCGERVA